MKKIATTLSLVLITGFIYAQTGTGGTLSTLETEAGNVWSSAKVIGGFIGLTILVIGLLSALIKMFGGSGDNKQAVIGWIAGIIFYIVAWTVILAL